MNKKKGWEMLDRSLRDLDWRFRIQTAIFVDHVPNPSGTNNDWSKSECSILTVSSDGEARFTRISRDIKNSVKRRRLWVSAQFAA
jgi:hypothetical protein